ncbi:hypothetical protein FQY83_03040 [Luteimonas marina]|uniref:Integrase catalytic domain-containing protein n=1 Tax=Luteimonas marina TaxID=488485 RepID=A0A5C5UCI8_9GAMM|nr:hypothetical protein [Luteimonas marina]TWT23619.1 hypothetical protein FQY83_03040 [Luteimonas marina]
MHRKAESLFPACWRDTSTWPTPTDREIPEKHKDAYARRKRIIEAYMRGASLRVLCKVEGVDTATVYTMLEACASHAHDGKIWGFRALVPYVRKKAYERSSEVRADALAAGRGTGGLFMQMLANHEPLRLLIAKQASKYASTNFTGRVPIKKEHNIFLTRISQLQGKTGYPFSLQNKGREGFRQAINAEIAKQRGEARVPLRDSVERAFRLQIDARYRNVQIDAHRLDSFIRVKFVGRKSRFKTRALRPWLIAAVEVDSEACLGWSLSVEREPSHLDLLRCLYSMMAPWERRQTFEIVGLDYNPDAGMPSGVIPRCAGRYVDSISLDNALCGHADNIRQIVLERLHATLRMGLPREPRTRCEIEQLFNTLTHRNIQHLVGGVRPNMSNRERASAMSAAEDQGLTVEQMEEYLDVVLCNYNAEPHSAHYGKSPLQVLREEPHSALIRSDMSPNASWRNLLKIEVTATIRSSDDHPPRINYMKGQYTNDVLRSSGDLLANKEVVLTVNLVDLRSVKAKVSGGIDLGTLYARGPWAHFVHDIRLRKKLNREIADGNFYWSEGVDPEEQVNDFLRKTSKTKVSQPSKVRRAQSASRQTPRSGRLLTSPRLIADVAKGAELDLEALLGDKLKG